jgi:hypothetical protein
MIWALWRNKLWLQQTFETILAYAAVVHQHVRSPAVPCQLEHSHVTDRCFHVISSASLSARYCDQQLTKY